MIPLLDVTDVDIVDHFLKKESHKDNEDSWDINHTYNKLQSP